MGKQSRSRTLKDNEVSATIRNLRTSPRKLNLVAGFIRGMKAEDAIAQLGFMKRRVAVEVKKLVESAVANAENNHELDVDNLYVAEASVGKAIVMKRWHARARGRGARVLKPFSRMTVVLREREGE